MTVPAHRNYKVANHKPVPVTVYDYYDRSQTARLFYEPTRARTCDICDGDECGSSCNSLKSSSSSVDSGSVDSGSKDPSNKLRTGSGASHPTLSFFPSLLSLLLVIFLLY